jgi:DNA-binding LacI/PurR family transcriptional regulator
MPHSQSVTLHQVAARVGVSHQTVSRVINGYPHVAEATRAAVLAAVDELGYRPNRAARHLVSKRSSLIGVVSYATDSYGPTRAVIGIDQATTPNGYRIALMTLKEINFENLRFAAGELRAYGAEGVILCLPIEIDLTPLRDWLADIPFVAIDAYGRRRYTTITVDHRAGAFIETEHLIREGHRRIACICGNLSWRCGRLRKEGWQRALGRYSLPVGPELATDWSSAGGYDGAKKLLNKYGGRFTAIVTGNDQIALGALQALREAGLEVPRHVSVVGFDDMPEAEFFNPPLTTIRLDFDWVATTSVECLMRHLKDPSAPFHHVASRPDLIVRQSTAKPRKS